MTYDEFFQRLTHCRLHDWQGRVAVDDACKDRLIRIPTGFGKTAGVTIAWLWSRVLEMAGLAHDVGKAHPAFAGAIKDRDDIAYAMADAGGIPAFNMRGRWRIQREAQPHGGADKGERDGRD